MSVASVKKRVVRTARGLPEPAKELAHRVLGAPFSSRRLRRALRPVRWGTLRRMQPVGKRWGAERGTPVDRFYLERYFRSVSPVIRGRVLEVRDPAYTDRFGHDVVSVDLVDIDPRNDEATIVADLAEAGSLPRESFDCAILPQTLQFVDDPREAIANLWQSLVPGGALIVTVPSVSRVDSHAGDADRWRWLPSGLRHLLEQACDPPGYLEVATFGNLLAATAFLHGVAAEELREDELELVDPNHAILACVTARKPQQ